MILTEAAEELHQHWRESRDLAPLLEMVRPFTMVRRESLAELAVSGGERIVLIDERAFRPMIGRAGDVLQFLARDGEYWGRPEDDDAAIRDLARLQRSGATMLAIAWPCFWWLQHYMGFARWLRANFRCTIESNRMVAFDLRTGEAA